MLKIASLMKKAPIQSFCILITLILLTVAAVSLYINGDEVIDYYIMDPLPASADEVEVRFSRSGIAEVSHLSIENNAVAVTYQRLSPGETKVFVRAKGHEVTLTSSLKVFSTGLIMDQGNGNMGGRRFLLLLITLWFFALAAVLLLFFRKNIAQKLYSYRLMYSNGFGLYLLLCAFGYLFLLIRTLQNPELYNGFAAVTALLNVKWDFLILGMPFMILFSLALTVSNIVLMRREGVRFQNGLGIALGVALILGEVFSLGLYGYYEYFPVFFQGTYVLCGIVTTVFIYFICMLVGAIISGIHAAKHTPPFDRDFVIILGCGIRKDGSLFPLIRGRVDKAVDFYRKQLAMTGHVPILIPSGGQGEDEICSEAAAMKRYLTETCGIPEGHILPEDQSATTLENMLFSKKLIDRHKPSAKTAFSTTNYHVFRSGILSQKAGLDAEGMGSPTKWYFWPNAFIREMAGLMVEKWRLVLSLLLLMTGLYLIPLFFLPI